MSKNTTSLKSKKSVKKSSKLEFKDFTAPSYGEIKNLLDKKLGVRPKRPINLPEGDWTEQAFRLQDLDHQVHLLKLHRELPLDQYLL